MYSPLGHDHEDPRFPDAQKSRHPFTRGALVVLAATMLTLSTTVGGLASLPGTGRAQAASTPAQSISGAIVVDWNKELLHILGTPGAQPATVHPTRSLALLHAAIYDAVVSITHSDAPYLFLLNAPAGA